MPVAYEDFVYLHMPKTGGMWVSNILLANGGHKIKGTGLHRHAGVSKLSEEHLQGKIVFGTIRDPWTWYVSLWRHLQIGKDGQALLDYLGQGSREFSPFLEGATNPEVWANAPKKLTESWWDWPERGDCGLYTATAKSIYGDRTDTVIDTALLYEGLEIITGLQAGTESHPPTNTSNARSGYLDPENLYGDFELGLVNKADGEFARRIGYHEPFGVLEDSAKPGNWCP